MISYLIKNEKKKQCENHVNSELIIQLLRTDQFNNLKILWFEGDNVVRVYSVT